MIRKLRKKHSNENETRNAKINEDEGLAGLARKMSISPEKKGAEQSKSHGFNPLRTNTKSVNKRAIEESSDEEIHHKRINSSQDLDEDVIMAERINSNQEDVFMSEMEIDARQEGIHIGSEASQINKKRELEHSSDEEIVYKRVHSRQDEDINYCERMSQNEGCSDIVVDQNSDNVSLVSVETIR